MKFRKGLFRGAYSDPIFQINGNINSLNFDYPFPNAERLEKEEKLNLLGYHYIKWLLILLMGLSIGFTILLVTLLIEELTILKTDLFIKTVLPMGNVVGTTIYIVFSVVCHIISSLVVIFWHPEAQGAGVSETLAYLNGVEIPGLENWTGIPARIISIVFMVLGGLPGGQTEALVPVGSILASTLCLASIGGYKFFVNHRYDSDRRDFGAVGVGAAASAAFGTPVGGAFFALQQLSKWHGGITFMIIVGSLTASYLFIVVYNALRGVDRVYLNSNSLFAPFNNEHKPKFDLEEFPSFAVMAVIGGVLGSLWISIHVQLCRFRLRYVTKAYAKILDIIIIAILTGLPFVLFFYHVEKCSPKVSENKFGEMIIDKLQKSPCSNDQFYTSGLFLLSPETVMRTLMILPEEELSAQMSAILVVIIFLASSIHLGTSTTSGCIIPNLIIGTLWGRIFKFIVADHLYDESDVQITKYAYLGAVAQVAGVTQYSLAFGIMMIECVGIVNFSIPVFLVIFGARYISKQFISGIYEIVCLTKGYAFVNSEAPPLCADLTAKDIMGTRLVCFPLSISGNALKNAMLKYKHLEFPILDTGDISDTASGKPVGVCKGVILRKQIIPLLSAKRRESIVLRLPQNEVFSDVSDGMVIDIAKYMSVQHFFVHQDMPSTRVYSLFEALNQHSVLVVNDACKLVGIITRKDFAGFKVELRMYGCKMRLHVAS